MGMRLELTAYPAHWSIPPWALLASPLGTSTRKFLQSFPVTEKGRKDLITVMKRFVKTWNEQFGDNWEYQRGRR